MPRKEIRLDCGKRWELIATCVCGVCWNRAKAERRGCVSCTHSRESLETSHLDYRVAFPLTRTGVWLRGGPSRCSITINRNNVLPSSMLIIDSCAQWTKNTTHADWRDGLEAYRCLTLTWKTVFSLELHSRAIQAVPSHSCHSLIG